MKISSRIIVFVLVVTIVSFGLSGCVNNDAKVQRKSSESSSISHLDPCDYTFNLMLTEYFGPNHNKPAPMPSIKHLPRADVCFAVIADLHVGKLGEEKYFFVRNQDWQVEDMIRQLNSANPEFVINLGDNTWGMLGADDIEDYRPRAEWANEVMKKINAPLYSIPGTHDFYPPVREQEGQRFEPSVNEKYQKIRQIYQKFFGPDHQSFEKNNYSFILANSAIANIALDAGSDQMQWLKDKLEGAKSSRLRLLFIHDPLFWRSPDETIDTRNVNTFPQPARSQWLDLLADSKVDVVYSGHVHFDFANIFKNTYMHTINAASCNREFLQFSGTPVPFPTLAQTHDPYKLGFLLVRVNGSDVYESWIPSYWRVAEPPEKLRAISGDRLIGRPANEISDSVLGITAAAPDIISQTMPPTFWFAQETVWDMVNDIWWRSSEKVGAKWQQLWPLPNTENEWKNTQRALSLGRLRGVNLAVHVPADANQLTEYWNKYSPYKEAISAVVVCNGLPNFINVAQNPQLVTWKCYKDANSWVNSCQNTRKLVPENIKIALARLPLRSEFQAPPIVPINAAELIKNTASKLSGRADALCVWMNTQQAPELLMNDLYAASQVCNENKLELWLDAVGWEFISEPMRSSYFLRLMAICQAYNIRLFWWNGPADKAGLIDGFYDPTPMFYAAQAWQSVVDKPVGKVEFECGDIIKLKWTDRQNRKYFVWWKPADSFEIGQMQRPSEIPSAALIVDPLHSRILNIESNNFPICSWPLIARY